MTVYKVRFNAPKFLGVRIEALDLMPSMGGGAHLPNGESVAEYWKTPPATLVDTRSGASEIPSISQWEGEMVLSPTAYQKLKVTLGDDCEFLELLIGGETWQLVNVLTHIDEVDQTNSELEMMDGLVVDIKKLAFQTDKVKDTLLFRTHYGERTDVYCSDKFVRLFNELGLTGLIFQEDLAYNGPVELGPFYS